MYARQTIGVSQAFAMHRDRHPCTRRTSPGAVTAPTDGFPISQSNSCKASSGIFASQLVKEGTKGRAWLGSPPVSMDSQLDDAVRIMTALTTFRVRKSTLRFSAMISRRRLRAEGSSGIFERVASWLIVPSMSTLEICHD